MIEKRLIDPTEPCQRCDTAPIVVEQRDMGLALSCPSCGYEYPHLYEYIQDEPPLALQLVVSK